MSKICFLFLGLLSACQNDPLLESKVAIFTIDEILIESYCPKNMIWINGNYCPKVIQNCKSWMESPDITPFARCQEFFQTKCVSEKQEMNFCIDKDEYSETKDNLPMTNVSWTEAKEICEQNNKRLCHESEWELACEGEEILPYTNGYFRPSYRCNIDVSKDVICGNGLCDHRRSILENPDCVSPFNVHNMSGNADEWIEVPKYEHSKMAGEFMRSALKGGHWLPVRNRCRPKTVDHNESFRQISVGFRCCQDVQ